MTALAGVDSGRPVEQLEAELLELAGNLNAAECRFLLMFAEFDRRDGWVGFGVRSAAHWLNWRCGIDLGAARERVRVAKALGGLPAVTAAFAAGRLSYAKVRAVTRVATPATEAELVQIALHGTAAHVERLVRAYRRMRRLDEADAAVRAQAARAVRWRYDDDGTVLLTARLTPEEAAVVKAALAAKRAELDADATPARDITPAQPRTDGADPSGGAAADDAAEPPEPADWRETGDVAAAPSEREARRRGDDVAAGPPEPGWEDDASVGPSGRDPSDEEGVSAEPAGHDGLGDAADDVSAAPPGQAERRLRRCPPGWHPPEVTNRPRSEPEAVETPPGDADDPHAARDADALVALADAALAHPGLAGGGGWELIVHADAASLGDPDTGDGGRLDHGPALAADTLRRLGCDAAVRVMLHDGDGLPIDVGRRSRTIPAPLRRALQTRDRGCRWPGCTATRRVDGHHLKHWADGGATDLANLLTLCRFHHRLVHEHGYHVTAAAPGRFAFSRPDGSTVPDHQGTGGSAAGLADANAVAGVRVTAATADCRWQGEPLDLDYALDGLDRLERAG